MESTHIAALLVATTACAFDLRTGRVPNSLTFGGGALAFVFHLTASGLDGGASSVAGGALAMALLFAPFALGGMGGGDLKLVGAVGAWLGPRSAFWLVVYTGTIGGALALAIAVRRGYVRHACRNLRMLLKHWRAEGLRPLPGLTLENPDAPRLAYALPILGGTVVTLCGY